MKKIDESAINSQIGMLSPGGLLQFLQDAIKDNTLNIILGLTQNITSSSTGVVYVLNGAVNLSAIPSTQWSSDEGVAFYNNELFYIQLSILTTLVNHAVVVLDTSFNNISANADPVLFTDSVSRNVLQTRTLKIVDGTSATAGYICDASAMSYTTNNLQAVQNYTGGSTTGTITLAAFLGTGGIRKGNTKLTVTMQLHVGSSIYENAQLTIIKNGSNFYQVIETLGAVGITFYRIVTMVVYFTGISVVDAISLTLTSVGGNSIIASNITTIWEAV